MRQRGMRERENYHQRLKEREEWLVLLNTSTHNDDDDASYDGQKGDGKSQT